MQSRLKILVIAGLLTMAAAGCGGGKQDQGYSQAQQKADIQYVLSLDKGTGFTPLDLKDDRAYRFFMNQLHRAGISEERAPQLHRVIEESRQSTAAGSGCDSQAISSGKVAPIIKITDLGTENAQSHAWYSSGLSSIPEGSTTSRLTLTLYDKDLIPIGPTGDASDYEAGTNLTVDTSGDLPAPEDNQVQGIMSYIYIKDGLPCQGFATSLTATFPQSIQNDAPVITVQQPDHNQIKVCLNRQNAQDCDYYQDTTIENVEFPVQGNTVYFGDIEPLQFDQQGNPTNAFARLQVTRPGEDLGGGCDLCLGGDCQLDVFFSDPATVINGDTLSWSLNPAQFGDGSACFANGAQMVFTMAVQVSVIPEGGTNGAPVAFFITNADGAEPNLNTVVIPPMKVVYGCLAKDSRILMADGKEKEIQHIVETDRVRQKLGGAALNVQNVITGTEGSPMIRLKDNQGHSLLLTDGHPVMTPGGAVLARRLRVGDEVLTLEGQAVLTAIERETYTEKVWNLEVGVPTNPEVHLDNDNRTFYANGILVGDNTMQAVYGELDRQKKETILERLPTEWHQDFLNDLAARQKKGQ